MRKYRIYRNLHKSNYSILGRTPKGWRKIDEADEVDCEDCAILIQIGGQARVRREKKKCVHAYVCCNSYSKKVNEPKDLTHQISYNPYTDDTFVYKGKRGRKISAPLYHRRLHLRTDKVLTTETNPHVYPNSK